MIKPKKTIEKIKPYETDKYLPIWDYKLDSNENFYGANEAVINAIKNFDIKKISLYPCYGELVDKLASVYSVSENSILLTNGCDEALSLLISTYLDKNETILSYNPSFSMPLLYASAQGAKIKQVDYREKFEFSQKDFEKNINSKVKIAYLATPNNPTGEVVDSSVIKKMAINNKKTLFIVDCTYVNFATSVCFEDYVDLINLENVAVVKSFSKDFALAGLRLGFVLAKPEIIQNLKKVSSPYNVNAVAIQCALSVLEDKTYFEKIKNDNKIAFEALYKGLIDLGYKPYKSQGNFILCDFSDHKDFIFNKLKSNKIIVRKYSENSPLKNCLRITLPNLEGVNKILELLKPRPLFVFDLDGVVFDVSQSYRQAIIKTYEYFAKKTITASDIQEVKNQGGMSNDWKVTKYLLDKAGLNISYKKTVETFQDMFFDKNKPMGLKGLIDNEKLVFNKDFFEKLQECADCAVFTSRDGIEAFYSLEKFDIKKYFYWFTTSETVKDKPKPSPYGLEVIKKHCPYTDIFYFGDTIDDVKAGVEANVSAFGIIPPNASEVDKTIEKLINQGAKMVFKNPNEILEADLINKFEKFKNKEEKTCV